MFYACVKDSMWWDEKKIFRTKQDLRCTSFVSSYISLSNKNYSRTLFCRLFKKMRERRCTSILPKAGSLVLRTQNSVLRRPARQQTTGWGCANVPSLSPQTMPSLPSTRVSGRCHMQLTTQRPKMHTTGTPKDPSIAESIYPREKRKAFEVFSLSHLELSLGPSGPRSRPVQLQHHHPPLPTTYGLPQCSAASTSIHRLECLSVRGSV
jgi:hypothetical protein